VQNRFQLGLVLGAYEADRSPADEPTGEEDGEPAV
jgi:hypothetical protein